MAEPQHKRGLTKTRVDMLNCCGSAATETFVKVARTLVVITASLLLVSFLVWTIVTLSMRVVRLEDRVSRLVEENRDRDEQMKKSINEEVKAVRQTTVLVYYFSSLHSSTSCHAGRISINSGVERRGRRGWPSLVTQSQGVTPRGTN